MSRATMRAQALQAAKHAKHNLDHIKKHPDCMLQGTEGAETYLGMLIRFSEQELSLKRRLINLWKGAQT